MLSPVPQHARTLGEVLFADVALVWSYSGMGQHVLIKVTGTRESFLTDGAEITLRLTMLQLPVIDQFLTAAVFLAALFAFEALLVQPQVIVQYDPLTELFVAEMASVLVFQFLVPFTMLPLVAAHVDHRFAAEPANLGLRVVRLLHVQGQICLHLVAASAMLAHELRLVVAAVDAQVVSLHAVSFLELRVADVALEEVVRLMDHLVLLQCSLGLIGLLAVVALVRLAMNERDVVLHYQGTAEVFAAKRTDVLDLLEDLVHLRFGLLRS